MVLCNYGCGCEGRFQLKNGKHCCSEHYNSCAAIRKKNSSGLKKAHAAGKMYKFSADDVILSNEKATAKAIKENFVTNSTASNEWLKKQLVSHFGIDYKCSECDISTWHGKLLVLHLDHINGINSDSRFENLRLLCPNCHSLTETYCGKGNSGKVKVPDDELIEAIITSINTRCALKKAGLTPKGGNYNRVKNLIHKHNLKFKE